MQDKKFDCNYECFICSEEYRNVHYLYIIECNLLYNLGTSSGCDGILIGTLIPPILMESPPITTITLDFIFNFFNFQNDVSFC